MFFNIVPNLKISTENKFDSNFSDTGDPVLNAISKYRNRPSAIMIKKKNTQVVFRSRKHNLMIF